MAKKLKPVVFNTESSSDRTLLDAINMRGLNFSKETKLMWLSRIGEVPLEKTRSLQRIAELKGRLENETLHRSHIWKIENEIKEIKESLNESN